MKQRFVAASALLAMGLLGIALVAFGQGKHRSFSASLSGYEEVPAVSSAGYGRFHAKLDPSETSLTYELTYSDLEGTTTTMAHIHFGQPGANGGVSVWLCGGGGKPACPAGSGTLSGVLTAADVVGPSSQGIDPGEFGELLEAMREGMTYVNIHTNKHTGGEIRGQIRHRPDGKK
jgi:hypothetical protein